MMLTAKRLRELLNYDPLTGLFCWLADTGTARAGDVAGCLHHRGYTVIRVDGVLHLGHRLAWLHVKGEWPPSGIDHADGNRSNNRFSNLRVATQSQNSANRVRHRNNLSGFKGVTRRGEKWEAAIMVAGHERSLGRYSTPEEAHAAYCAAAAKAFGEFARG